ncbi:MAG: hypothetical protein Barrevirus39_2 [Barrevirus sp.]|uniref:Uncharacterized protein n=1 Tax=Barrevirus sp. TaxID=2487763 RepID=A0A3G4ZSQ3_9VIRU|nr:MAG: hypothetical protein Barrevirus39_2 [Barrevirus sp.]
MEDFNNFIENWDFEGEGEDEGEESKITYVCPFYEEMKDLLSNISPCTTPVRTKGQYCKNHNRCYNCHTVTKQRDIKFCHICICTWPNCNKYKLPNDTTCGIHHCKQCKGEKKDSDDYCYNCKCPSINCNELKIINGPTCIKCICPICNSVKKGPHYLCDNEECKCRACNNLRTNKASCANHECPICIKDNLYDIADSFTIDRSYVYPTVHAIIIGKSVIGLRTSNTTVCPNLPVSPCLALEKGYTVSDNCAKVIPILPWSSDHIIGICKDCQQTNKCYICNTLRSLNPIVRNKGITTLCDKCVKIGKCLNCMVESWVYQIGKSAPELCDKCIDLVKVCCMCDKVYPNNTNKFLDYETDKTNVCCNCIISRRLFTIHNKPNDEAVRKAGLICFRDKNESFLKFVRQIGTLYRNHNPDNSISDPLIYELMVTLQWLISDISRELYIDTFISFMKEPKSLEKRLSRINNCNKVQYYRNAGRDYELISYTEINLLSLMYRIANLPKDLFYYILALI